MNAMASEFLQLKGDLLLAQSRGNPSAGSGQAVVEVESLYQDAVHVAGEVQAPMMELRSALRLSRLWRERGRTEEAHKVLSGAYGKITEGFATVDMSEARTLLDELAGGLVEQGDG
jgi:predicted ATPase